MALRLSENDLSQMVFYHVLQCLIEHSVPKEHIGQVEIDVSDFKNGSPHESVDDEPIVQGAMIFTKQRAIEHEPPIATMLRSIHAIHIAFPKLMSDVTFLVRLTRGSVTVESSGKDCPSDEVFEQIKYFGEAISDCVLRILPPGTTICYKQDFQTRLMNIMEKFSDFIASLPDDDDDDDTDTDEADVECSTADDDETDE